ncbi:MAG: VCBS repeat-containing protein [Planctomycetales bacterium]|nr:VCBS repeat-containing protein [Planctomycetales bacterium]
MRTHGGLAIVLLAGCFSARPEGEPLAIVRDVEALQAVGRKVTSAIQKHDPDLALEAFAADYREAGGGADEAVLVGAAPGGLAVTEYGERPGPQAGRASVAARVARYSRVDGTLFKVRKVLERSEERVLATCEQRIRGVLADGRREEETRWLLVEFRREAGAWKIARVAETGRNAVCGGADSVFEDWTAGSGISQVYVEGCDRHDDAFYPGEHSGGGIAASDVDRDGDPDLVFAGSARLALWLNRGDGRFEDATDRAGFKDVGPLQSLRGVLCADFDADGSRDLFLAVYGGPNQFYRGKGDGTFTEATVAAGLAESGVWSTCAAAADVDGDGDLDLFVGGYGTVRERPVDFMARNGEADRLFRNRGDGTFEDVTEAAGVGHTGYALAAAFADVTGDGAPDLYVANDFAFNALYVNRGDGTFEDRTKASKTNDVGMGMGVSWADFDADGDLDLYVSNMFSSVGQWIFEDPDYPVPGLVGWLFRGRVLDILRKMAAGNSLLRNNGDGTFTDVGAEAGASNGGWAWSSSALDYDGDGWTDIYVVNGFVTGEDPEDL